MLNGPTIPDAENMREKKMTEDQMLSVKLLREAWVIATITNPPAIEMTEAERSILGLCHDALLQTIDLTHYHDRTTRRGGIGPVIETGPQYGDFKALLTSWRLAGEGTYVKHQHVLLNCCEALHQAISNPDPTEATTANVKRRDGYGPRE